MTREEVTSEKKLRLDQHHLANTVMGASILSLKVSIVPVCPLTIMSETSVTQCLSISPLTFDFASQ